MAKLETFIKDARSKGLKDNDIRDALLDQGWSEATINAALAGIAVPKPDAASTKEVPAHSKQLSLSPLMAALHHILLWFFTGSSTVTIAGVVASLFGTNVSSAALASMIAVTVVTFIPYATLFILYLSKTRKTPDLIPGKIWSIITICLHSIGAMIAAITLIVNLITGDEMTVVVSAVLILILDLLIVKVYLFAAFSSEKFRRLRTIVLYTFIPLLFVLFGVLFGMSALRLGPAQHDEKVREALAGSVRTIADYTRTNQKLPISGSEATLAEGVSYTKKTAEIYEVCATFQTTNRDETDYAYRPSYDQTDSYVSDSSFYNSATGNQCFTFKSDYLSSDYLRLQTQ